MALEERTEVAVERRRDQVQKHHAAVGLDADRQAVRKHPDAPMGPARVVAVTQVGFWFFPASARATAEVRPGFIVTIAMTFVSFPRFADAHRERGRVLQGAPIDSMS